jgi:hypothetical protein
LGDVVIGTEAKGKSCLIGRTGLKTQTSPKDKPSSSLVCGLYLLGLGELCERKEYHDNDTSTNQPSLLHQQSSLCKTLLKSKWNRFLFQGQTTSPNYVWMST